MPDVVFPPPRTVHAGTGWGQRLPAAKWINISDTGHLIAIPAI